MGSSASTWSIPSNLNLPQLWYHLSCPWLAYQLQNFAPQDEDITLIIIQFHRHQESGVEVVGTQKTISTRFDF